MPPANANGRSGPRVHRSPLIEAVWRSLRGHPFEAVGVALAVTAVALAIVGPLLARYDPYLADFASRLQPPSWAHPMGTDPIGRDVLSRVLYGARLTLSAAFAVILVATVIGVIVGTIAAMSVSWVDDVLMRITDVALSLPPLVLALGIAASLGRGLTAAIVALAISWWPGYARLVRSLVLEVKEREFVEAARTLGASRSRVVFRHVLPNSLETLFVQTTLDVANVTLTVAGLSFIGVGALPPEAEWGAMIADGRAYIFSAWWVVLFPGLAMALTAVGFFLLGDLLRAELDPRLRLRGAVILPGESILPAPFEPERA